jgi:hypothetical protein
MLQFFFLCKKLTAGQDLTLNESIWKRYVLWHWTCKPKVKIQHITSQTLLLLDKGIMCECMIIFTHRTITPNDFAHVLLNHHIEQFDIACLDCKCKWSKSI